MYRALFASTALVGLIASPALAQQSGPGSSGFSIGGQIVIGMDEFNNATPTATRYYNVDLEGQLALYEGFGIGFDVDAFGEFGESDSRDRYSLYAYYEFNPGQQLRVGLMPSAVDQLLIDERLALGNGRLALFQQIGEPFANLIAFEDGEEPYALGYSGDYGAINAAATAHFNRNGDGETYALSGSYTGTVDGGLQYTLGAGAEFVRSDTADDAQSFWLAAGVEYGAWSADIVLADSGLTFGGEADVINLATRYEIEQIDGLSLGVDYLNITTSSGSIWAAGLGAEYVHDTGLGARGSLQAIDQGGMDFNGAQVELFFRF